MRKTGKGPSRKIFKCAGSVATASIVGENLLERDDFLTITNNQLE